MRETQAQGEKLAGLRDTAARINDFSQKHDSSIIQSLVLSASKRLAKVQQQVAKRGTLLEEARKRAKQVAGAPGWPGFWGRGKESSCRPAMSFC